MSRLVVRHDAGDRYDAFVRGHVLRLDQPGSGDSGLTPLEAFVVSLASCAAFYAGRFLARHGIAGHNVECQYEQDPSGAITRVDLRLEVRDPLPDQLRAGVLRVMEHCTVVRSIRGPLEVTVDTVARQTIGAA